MTKKEWLALKIGDVVLQKHPYDGKEVPFTVTGIKLNDDGVRVGWTIKRITGKYDSWDSDRHGYKFYTKAPSLFQALLSDLS